MIRTFALLIFFIIAANFTFCQSNDLSPLRGRLLLSFNGAVTFPKADFINSIPAPLGIGAIEYYFDIESKSTFGILFYGGIGTLEGIDDNRIPNKYSDNFYFFGSGLNYSFAINNQFIPYLSLGVSNLWYNPKDNNGNAIITSKPASEDLSTIAYNYELGLKIFLSASSTLNIGGGEFICMADNLDGVIAGNHNDVIFYGMVGVSIAFWGESDTDGDGVPDSEDACEDTPAGVEVDMAGCPVDSDGDGIPDYLDNCPNTPSGMKVNSNGCPEDSNRTNMPDSFQKKIPESETKFLRYDLQNERLVKNMIYTDGQLYTVQISSWRTKGEADREFARLVREGYDTFVTETITEYQTWYRVRVGYFKTFREAQELAYKLR